jgi:hypothetical protein
MSQRVENNQKILASLRDSDANRDHIFKQCWKRFKAISLATIMLKRIRKDEQTALTNAELYLDDWGFHRGGITKANIKEAMTDCVDRVIKVHQAKQQHKEDAEFRAMQGALGEFGDDGPMEDLGGDAEFEAEILKQHPELKAQKR